jgi:cation:H+ antiporter
MWAVFVDEQKLSRTALAFPGTSFDIPARFAYILIASFGLIVAGIFVLYLGAEFLVRGSASLATRHGVSALIVGITVVAYGTSMPELVVSVQSALSGAPDIAVSNVTGSNICTIGIVLGVAAMVRPLKVELSMIRWHVPLTIFGTLLLAYMLWDGVVTRFEGSILFTGIILYTLANLRAARRERAKKIKEEFENTLPATNRKPWIDPLLILAGLAGLFFGGKLLIAGAIDVARAMQLSEAMIAVTVVAIGTSCPDLVASVVAAYRNEPDIAVGNAIGSTLFNIFNVMGVAALTKPLAGYEVNPLDLGFMVGIAMLTLPLMITGFKLQRREGALLVAVYLVWLALRWSA